jgi:hypothetical protein
MRLDGGHRELSAEIRQWRIYDLFEAGEIDTARAEQAELDALAAELRQPLFLSIAAGWRGVWSELDGDVEEAERWAESCLRHGERAHAQDALSIWGARMFGIRRRQGRLAELAPVVERLAASGASCAGWPTALGLVHLDRGDVAAARAVLATEFGDGPERLPRGMFWLANAALLSELAVTLEDIGRAEALYAALAPFAHRNVIVAYSTFWGPVDRYLARLAATVGDDRLAARHAAVALERTRAMNAPLLSAQIQAEHGGS